MKRNRKKSNLKLTLIMRIIMMMMRRKMIRMKKNNNLNIRSGISLCLLVSVLPKEGQHLLFPSFLSVTHLLLLLCVFFHFFLFLLASTMCHDTCSDTFSCSLLPLVSFRFSISRHLPLHHHPLLPLLLLYLVYLHLLLASFLSSSLSWKKPNRTKDISSYKQVSYQDEKTTCAFFTSFPFLLRLSLPVLTHCYCFSSLTFCLSTSVSFLLPF